MAFTKDQLLLPADKVAQLTKGLATLGVPDPLQYLCDEAAAAVARLTTGYILDDAFDRVELFDSEDLTGAFQFLLITEQRVCVIVPLEAKFEQVFPERGAASRKLTSKREVPVVLLCSDRVLGDRKAALYGSDTERGSLCAGGIGAAGVRGTFAAKSERGGG
jgi:hypothetical protein